MLCIMNRRLCAVVATLGLLLAVVAVGGCSRPAEWPTAEPRTIPLDRPAALMFEGALRTFQMSGYKSLVADPDRLYIQVQSLVDGDAVQTAEWGVGWKITTRISQLNLQFQSDNSLIVTVTGFHVRAGKLDPRVADEVNQVIAAMRSNAPTALPRTTSSPSQPATEPSSQPQPAPN